MTCVEKAKTYLKRQSCYLSFAILLTNAAFIGAVALQSSVNIAGELGITSLAVSYGSCMICNLTVTTFLRKRLGPKLSLIIATFFFIFYTLANIYPTYLTLTTSSFLLGAGQALMWSNIPKFNSFYGEQYSQLVKSSQRKNRDYGYYVRRFTGKFFGLIASYLIIGNIPSYIILQFDNNVTTTQGRNNSYFDNHTASYELVTFANPQNENTILFHCGANMCSATQSVDEDVENEKTKYLIYNWTLRLLLFSFYTVLQVASLLIVIFALKDVKKENFSKPKHDETASIMAVNEKERKEESQIWYKEIGENLKSIFRHFMDPQELCIVPLNLHLGLVLGFIFGDFTRSFISCIAGVQQVGLVIAVHGVIEILSGTALQQFGARLGRFFFFIISYAFELFSLSFCFLWKPSEDIWITYMLAICFGVSDGLRQPLVSATVMEYFNHKADTAFSVLPLLTGLGSAVSYLLSRFICVKLKLSILIAFTVFSFLCFMFGERRFKNREVKT